MPANAPDRGIRAQIRRRLTQAFAVAFGVLLTVASALLLWQAAEARRLELQGIKDAAVNLSRAFDREVAGARSLLTGLSTSPALQSGDLRTFYDQLKATPVPEGSWLVLFDSERQLLNTLRPFGTAGLPRIADFGRSPQDRARPDLERFKRLGFTVTGRMFGIIAQVSAVGVNLKVAGPDGELRYILTTILSDPRLKAILDEQRAGPGRVHAVYDRDLGAIIAARDREAFVDFEPPAALKEHLSRQPSPEPEGLVYGTDKHGVPIAIAYRRSDISSWTVTAVTPVARLEGPFYRAFAQMAGAALVLLLLGGLTAKIMSRTVDAPIDSLETSVAEARREVGELSQRLLHLQEDEHQRIARELHDSTAQHLVAAVLGLMRLTPKFAGDRDARAIGDEVKQSVDQALTELRIFSYLLHPPNLAGSGLKMTVEDFVHGFARRTDLECEVTVDAAVDAMPFDLQRSILRIAQEALANTHRHAKATRVSVRLAVTGERLLLVIEDDGHGRHSEATEAAREADDPHQYGVGIPGMRARLIPFGGTLEIHGTPHGTTVRATVPLNGIAGSAAPAPREA